jgi:hypothetical protein
VACPNHAYPFRHKLKNYNMMKTFMISGPLPGGMDLDEDPGGSDLMPFTGEDVVMTVYSGRLLLGRGCMSKLSPSPPTRCCWVRRGTGCKDTKFPISLYI